MSWVSWAVLVPTIVLASVLLSRGFLNPRVLGSNLAFLFAGVLCSWIVAPEKALAGTVALSTLVRTALFRLGIEGLFLRHVKMAYLAYAATLW